MSIKKILINRKLKIGILIFIPLFSILLVVLCRYIITPSNEEIISNLRNTKCYSSKVDYVFNNSRSQFHETTMQYYSLNQGARIEFMDEYQRVKVYKGGEIKVEGNEDEEYILDKDMDTIYPLAFIENILSNSQIGEVKEVKTEWAEETYLQVNIEYISKNKHLSKAEFYIDKNKRVPVLLKILDDDNNERIKITYEDFKPEKKLNDSLF